MSPHQHPVSPLLVALVTALALTACGRNDERVDAAHARTERQAEQVTTDAAKAMDKAKQATDEAGAKMANAVSDAAITAAVSAELARDPSLDASKIDVDASQGHVVLRGSAPDAAAKDHAKRIALAVSGVRAVDNYLTVPKS